MDKRVSRISAEIAAVVERNLRVELLHEREAVLRKELEAVRSELGRLSGTARAGLPAPRPVTGLARPAERATGSKPMRGASARALMIRALNQSPKPMTIKELTRTILRRGWKSVRKNPAKTVDATLRNNPKDFRRTAPSTFELNQ